MKKIVIASLILVMAVFAGFSLKRGTVYVPESRTNLGELSYYGQYNSYNNKFRTNYVRPYTTRSGRYVNGYYRS